MQGLPLVFVAVCWSLVPSLLVVWMKELGMDSLAEAQGVAYVVWGTGGARVKDMSHVFGGEAGVFCVTRSETGLAPGPALLG